MFMLYLFILIVLHGAYTQEGCVPNPVDGLQLDEDGRLHWQDVTNCQITGYMVYMALKGDVVTHIFQVLFPYVHVTTLPACEDYRFTVTAISYNLTSEETVLETKLPAYPNSNVTVTEMHATPANNGVFLEWQLDEKWAYCVEYFRVARWDGQSAPVDLYTSYDTVVIEDLVPCTQYEFTVTPIYNNDMEGGIGVVPFESPAQSAPLPTLESVRPGTTFFDMTLNLPSYSTNRCPINSVFIDGSPYANLTIPITDSPTRPAVNVHVESLQPDRMYQFHVTLINSAGASTPLPIAIQTLPATK